MFYGQKIVIGKLIVNLTYERHGALGSVMCVYSCDINTLPSIKLPFLVFEMSLGAFLPPFVCSAPIISLFLVNAQSHDSISV